MESPARSEETARASLRPTLRPNGPAIEPDSLALRALAEQCRCGDHHTCLARGLELGRLEHAGDGGPALVELDLVGLVGLLEGADHGSHRAPAEVVHGQVDPETDFLVFAELHGVSLVHPAGHAPPERT